MNAQEFGAIYMIFQKIEIDVSMLAERMKDQRKPKLTNSRLRYLRD